MKSLILIVLMFTGTANAALFNDMGIAAGYRMNDGDTNNPGDKVEGKGGLVVGGMAYMPINDKFIFRTGFLYSQRNYEYDAAGTKLDVEFGYVDIPLSVMYSLEDLGGIFFGGALGLNVSDKCDSTTCDPDGTIMPLQFGGHFKIAPQFAMEVYYEMLSGEIVEGIEDTTAVGVNLIVTLE